MLNSDACEIHAYFLKQVLPPPQTMTIIDSESCDLPRKFLAYSGRGTVTSAQGPNFFIECEVLFFAPSAGLRACLFVTNHSAANGRSDKSGP